MLLIKTVIMKWVGSNTKYYIEKGYNYTKQYDEFEVKVEDLPKGSNVYVDVQCDGCGELLKPMKWQDYLKCLHKDNKYYCMKCSNRLFGVKTRIKNNLKDGKNSFGYWLIKNLSLKKAVEIIVRWDDELNKCDIREVSYGTEKKYYLKCSRGIHKPEIQRIKSFTCDYKSNNLNCRQCNSIAQWGIDNLGDDFLEKYWSKKNYELGLDPWKISCGSNKKVWIKCQKKDYHENYKIPCTSFINGSRCPYCGNKNGKVHPLDSLGQYIMDNYGKEFLDKIWSEKNEKSPFEYSPKSQQKAWFKCLNVKHDDYYRSIDNSNTYNFRCPECNFSKGEKRIEDYLKINNFIKDIDYIPQMKFDKLIGINNGLLSYDFYLPQYNLLIEYQGEMHERFVKGIHKSKKDFEKQVEHDRRKQEYADDNNIKLLPIWYWNYDNIEKILDEQLNINKHILYFCKN